MFRQQGFGHIQNGETEGQKRRESVQRMLNVMKTWVFLC